MAHDFVLPPWFGLVDGCIWPVQTACCWYACVYLFACAFHRSSIRQRPAIVPPMVYLHLTQVRAWCEMWFIGAVLRPVLWRQRYLLSCPPHCIIYWLLSLHTAFWLLLMWQDISSVTHSKLSLAFSSHLLPAVSVRWICHCSTAFLMV